MELEVRAATELGYELFRKCLEALPSCDASTLTPARTGDLLKQNETTITEWNGLGLVLKNPAGWDLTVETIELNDDLTEARVTVCWNDSRWLVYPASGPDGSDVIYGDGGPSAPTESARETLLLRREGAAWLAYDGTGDGESSTEEDLCAAT